MPHIMIKLNPGYREEDKKAFAEKMAESMTEIMGTPNELISISFEEIGKDVWKEEMYLPEIIGKAHLLYKKPGYTL